MSSCRQVFPCGRRDGQTDEKLIDAFRSFANAPKKGHKCYIKIIVIIIIIMLYVFFENSFGVLNEVNMGGRTCMAVKKNSLTWWRRNRCESNVKN
jgi:hypothetical protein